MSVEKQSPDETPAGETEAGALARDDARGEVVGREGKVEEKKLRIVVQVEVKAEIDESDDGKKVSASADKISVVSEHVRAIIRIIGGGDVT
ncbi:MAG TPA: hypothetical protein VFS43_07470 [Polyangiaceae bacterium]|nr:hypothetical protein [Polyangiaceae bacterium]